MSKYTITITNRYEVEADSPEHALASYRVVFDEADPEILGIDFWQVIPQDQFEYLDGKGEAVESIPEMSQGNGKIELSTSPQLVGCLGDRPPVWLAGGLFLP